MTQYIHPLRPLIQDACYAADEKELLIQKTPVGTFYQAESVNHVFSLVHRVSMAVVPVWKEINAFWQRVFHGPSLPALPIPMRDLQTFMPTIEHLEICLGKTRSTRALKQIGLETESFAQRGYSITKAELASYLQAASFICVHDVVELLVELQQDQKTIRGMSEDTTKSAKKRFSGKITIEACSMEDLDVLDSMLQPCKTLKELLVGGFYSDGFKMEKLFSKNKDLEAAAVARFLLCYDQKLTEQEWDVLMLKRFTCPPLPEGLLLRTKKGYLVYSHTVETGGASKRFFKSLHPDVLHSKIIYRGTRGALLSDQMYDSFLSIREDLTTEVGAGGIMETYDHTKLLLTDPKHGFVRSKNERVDIYGYSLGGAQAMRDCVLFTSHIHSLTTLCTPGIEKETVALFASKMKQHDPAQPISIRHIVDAGDFCDSFGEALLGCGCQETPVRVRMECQVPESDEPYVWPEQHKSLFASPQSIFKEIPLALLRGIGAHIRVTPLAPYRTIAVGSDQPELLQRLLNHDTVFFDPTWEKIRRGFVFCSRPFPEFATQKAV